MSRITSAFQALSKEVIQLIEVFCSSNLFEVSRILEELQVKEKEKLDLTVKWQVMAEKERVLKNQGGAGGSTKAVECSTEAGDEERRQLKRRCSPLLYSKALHIYSASSATG
jgi:hypothetical protein